MPFAGFGDATLPSAVGGGGESQPRQGVQERLVRSSTRSQTSSSDAAKVGTKWEAPPRHLPAVQEEIDPSYVSFTGSPGYSHDADIKQTLAAVRLAANPSSAADVAEFGAVDVALNHCASGHLLEPLSGWNELSTQGSQAGTGGIRLSQAALLASLHTQGATQLDDETWAVEVTADEMAKHITGNKEAALSSFHFRLHHALRADSDGAPANHNDVLRMGDTPEGKLWTGAEGGELKNHGNNGSWENIKLSEVPHGRRLHRFVWVYKLKRDGTAKARLCVQGCTLESGVDYDQTFSSTLRYSSARALFAYAARRRCSVRSIDYVAAYLQGEFIEGEAVYCRMPPGYEELDENGKPYVCKVVKPIYGIPQAGRRLQRRVFPWMVEKMGMRQLDDSDVCIFVYDDPSGKETFTIGLYVDNLQLVHSAAVDSNGNALDKSSFYHKFITQLREDWDIVDEGPMTDLLAIEVRYNSDGSITLHQESYVKKLLAKYMPDGPPASLQRNSLPYSEDVLTNIIHALDASTAAAPLHPELVRPYQERLGALLYLATSTRADLAFIVPLLCRAMSRPTPELIRETDRVFAYLARHPLVGLTYSATPSDLHGYSDASWETRSSTSGWIVNWQGCAISWGSRKQHCVALSSCEAEIVALSEAAKDVVYTRKLLSGLDASYITGPSNLSTDNMGARALSYNPEFHDKSKHIERRHFFVRDMVEKFEISVPFVATANNWADFFTKPLKPKVFFAMRKIIMNEP